MGKHDKATGDSYYEARIEELERRLKESEENCSRLQGDIKKYNKWLSELEAAAEDKVRELKTENARLRSKIVRLVERYV